MRRSYLTFAIMMLTLFGCGGGVEGTGADQAALNPSTKIGDLSSAEIDAGCNTLRQQAFDGLVGPGQCKYLALVQTFYWARYQPDGNVTSTPLDLSTPEKAAAVCEQARTNCEQRYQDVTFGEQCNDASTDNQCVLEDAGFRARCNVPVGLLLECVQESLQYVSAQNNASNCRDTFNYQRAQRDLDRVIDGEIRPEQAFRFDPFPPYNVPSCDKIEEQCGFAIIDFSKCNPRFV